MATTETTRETTVRQALEAIRADFAGRDYLPGVAVYPCAGGELQVRLKATGGGDYLLGVFVAELVNHRGETVRKYEV